MSEEKENRRHLMTRSILEQVESLTKRKLRVSVTEAAHENEPRLAVPSCHGI